MKTGAETIGSAVLDSCVVYSPRNDPCFQARRSLSSRFGVSWEAMKCHLFIIRLWRSIASNIKLKVYPLARGVLTFPVKRNAD